MDLPDGTQIRIRPVDGSDREALVAGFERLSETSRFLRFFTGMHRLSTSTLDSLTDIDQDRHVAIGVFDANRPSDVGTADGLGIGVGRYFVDRDDPTKAEASVAVIDEYHGRGIGTVLLQSLVVVARERGIETFILDTLAENTGMATVLAKLGARPILESAEQGQLRFEVDVPSTAEPIKSTAGYRVMRELAKASD